MYKLWGFNISLYHGDKKLNMNTLRENIRLASLNICEKGWHIPINERYMQTIKKGALCTTQYLTYKRYKRPMTRSFVECTIHSINSSPQKGSTIKRLGANTIILENKNHDFNTKRFFWILCHDIHRDKKHYEAQEYPYHIIKETKWIRRTFTHVVIRWKIYSHQWLGGIAYILGCCKKGRRSIQNWKTAHFWPISNVLIDVRNINHGQHGRKRRQGIKRRKFWKRAHIRCFWKNYRKIRHRWNSTWTFLDIWWIWQKQPQQWYIWGIDWIKTILRNKQRRRGFRIN